MYQLKTDGGYDFGEVISALQKEIRRGNEMEAMYWALELYESYPKALWQRLRVIVNEDIGIANPQAIILIETLFNQYLDMMKVGKDGTMRLILANAILMLCRSEKSREADHFQCVTNQRRLQKGWRLDIPDYALDKHTRRGKQIGRGWAHWFEHGCKLVPPPKSNIYQAEALTLWPTMIKPAKTKGKGKSEDNGMLLDFEEVP